MNIKQYIAPETLKKNIFHIVKKKIDLIHFILIFYIINHIL